MPSVLQSAIGYYPEIFNDCFQINRRIPILRRPFVTYISKLMQTSGRREYYDWPDNPSTLICLCDKNLIPQNSTDGKRLNKGIEIGRLIGNTLLNN